MSSGVYSSNRIPSHGVILTLRNSEVAVRADPALVFFSILATGGLN